MVHGHGGVFWCRKKKQALRKLLNRSCFGIGFHLLRPILPSLLDFVFREFHWRRSRRRLFHQRTHILARKWKTICTTISSTRNLILHLAQNLLHSPSRAVVGAVGRAGQKKSTATAKPLLPVETKWFNCCLLNNKCPFSVLGGAAGPFALAFDARRWSYYRWVFELQNGRWWSWFWFLGSGTGWIGGQLRESFEWLL